MKYVSFVVDDLPLHYYQAELLLYSLVEFGGVSKQQIIVQCLDRVNTSFTDYLQSKDFNYTVIKPYLDGKYCNKLQQLDYFIHKKDLDGVLLLDTDMFILDELFSFDTSTVRAKVVDAPNPYLSTLRAIYKNAGLKEPSIISSDWNLENPQTFINNFNGGFYFIPGKYIDIINTMWKKWASWLYEREVLFENKNQFIHVDQISFSLALSDCDIPFTQLSANYNCPTHMDMRPSSLNKDETIKILHYHREINDFGLLNHLKIKDTQIALSISIANRYIELKREFFFFKALRKTKLFTRVDSDILKVFEKTIKCLSEKYKKVSFIVHTGTPKTATTTLQHLLFDKKEKLLEQGFLYPISHIHQSPPKHQWLVGLLLLEDLEELAFLLQKVLEESVIHDATIIILTTEGIYNHWWDFSNISKSALAVLAQCFNVKVINTFRKQTDFLDSFYRQNLKNPQISSVECYGKDLTFKQMCKDDWFIRHADYLGFIYECETIFGKNNVVLLKYSENIVQDLLKTLGIELLIDKQNKKNVGLSNISIELLRVLNRYNLQALDKSNILKELSKMDESLKKYDLENIDGINDNKDIEELVRVQNLILSSDYGLTF